MSTWFGGVQANDLFFLLEFSVFLIMDYNKILGVFSFKYLKAMPSFYEIKL